MVELLESRCLATVRGYTYMDGIHEIRRRYVLSFRDTHTECHKEWLRHRRVNWAGEGAISVHTDAKFA
jgi:hypothetical protein